MCEKEFSIQDCPSNRKINGFGRYCGRECRRLSQRRLPDTFICEYCKVSNKLQGGKIRRFCSRICYWKLASEGEIGSGYKDGRTKQAGYYAGFASRRRVMKRGNGGSHTQKEWMDLVESANGACVKCFRQEPDIRLTRDHIIPVIKGGTNDIRNIQPLCLSCNSAKRDRESINYLEPFLAF